MVPKTTRSRNASISQARNLRRNSTITEQRLWGKLRRRSLGGHYFRRQVPIGSFIVDFVCIRKKLVVEVDGGQHNYDTQRRKEQARTEYLHSKGYTVLRFWNNEVIDNVEGVCVVISSALHSDNVATPSQPSP